MLRKADFEGHGFQKEESRTLLSANTSAYMTNIFYYKEVNCSQAQVMQVLTEADKLLPGKDWSQYLDDNLRNSALLWDGRKSKVDASTMKIPPTLATGNLVQW